MPILAPWRLEGVACCATPKLDKDKLPTKLAFKYYVRFTIQEYVVHCSEQTMVYINFTHAGLVYKLS